MTSIGFPWRSVAWPGTRYSIRAPSLITVGELSSGVTRFATIYATGSHRFMLQVRIGGRANMTYHWLMYVIISLWNTTELCRTFKRDVPTTKRQIVTLEFKNLRNHRKKINNFEFWRKLTTVMGMWLQAFILTVIKHTSMTLGHPCCHSSRNDFLYHQRKNVPGSQPLSYRFATSEKQMLQVRADFFSILGIAYSVIKRHTYANLVALIIYNKSTDMWT